MAPKKEQRFEMAKLMELSEPLTVYLERIQGSTTEPVAMPALGRDRSIDQSGATPGTGWMRDDVAKLVPWVKDFWSGAGTYSVQVVDQNKKLMEWEFSIQLSDTVKQRNPPPLGTPNIVPPSAIQQVAPALVPAPQQAMAPQQQPQQQSAAMQSWGQPQSVPLSGGWQQQPAPPPQPQPWSQQAWAPPNGPAPQVQFGQPAGYGPQQGYGQPPPWNPWGQPQPPPWAQPAAPARDPEVSKQLKEVERQLEESRRREIELKYQQETEKNKADHQRQLDSLREEIRRGAEKDGNKENDEVRRAREDRERMERDRDREATERRFADLQASILKLAEAKRPSDDDDRFKRAEEEGRRRDEENKREREKEREEHRREMDKRDRDLKDTEMRREMKEQAERTERLFREAQNKGPDPLLEFMKESQRQALATQERIAQLQASQMQAQQASAIGPLQLISLLKERDSAGDMFMRNMMPALTGVIDLYRGAAENVVGLAGGGPAAAWQPVAEQVITSGKEIMDRYFSWKRDAEVSGNKAKIAQADSQAQAAHAAAHAQAAVAQMQQQGRQQAQQPQPQVTVVPGAPLNGAANGAPAAANGAAQAEPVNNVVPIRPRPTEQEMLGGAYEATLRLRAGVKSGSLDPAKAIDAILQGVNAVQDNNEKHPPGDPQRVEVPAFHLYAEERWADFIDVLIPQAPIQFKDECVRILVEETEPEKGEGAAPTDPATTV